MDLKKHAHILRQAKWFILLMTVVTGVAALTFSLVRPETYKTVVSFEVELVNRPVTPDYQYGAYYDLKASELYVQHLMSLFVTPAAVEQVYQSAGFGYTIDSLSRFTNRFSTKQFSSQNFSVQFTDYHRDSAEKLAAAVTDVVVKNAAVSGKVNDQQLFTVNAYPAVIAPSEVNPTVVTIVGVLAGLLGSIILVYIREYFRA